MDMILDIIFTLFAVVGPCMTFLMLRRLKKVESAIQEMTVVTCQRDEAIGEFMVIQIEQSITPLRVSLETIRELLDANKPITSEGKPNNWDSVKEAFKGPTRAIDLNERNRIK